MVEFVAVNAEPLTQYYDERTESLAMISEEHLTKTILRI